MAQAIGNFIDRIQIGNDDAHQIAIGSSAYGICNTTANTASKTVSMPGFVLNPGTTVHIKFTYENTASTPPTLSINNSTAKPIVQYGNTEVETNSSTTGWHAGAILTLTYDGTSWVRDQGYNTDTWRPIGQGATEAAAGNHTHGNIQNDGTLQINNNITIKNKDQLIIIDSTNDEITRSPITFDGSTTTKALTQKGTWETFNNYIHPTGDGFYHLPANGSANYIISYNGNSNSAVWTSPADICTILGLSNAMHFVGQVTSDSSYQPSDGTSGIPKLTNNSNYTPAIGDVVIDSQGLREYVYDGFTWILLGYTASTIYDSNLVTVESTAVNIPTWISRIFQNTEGKVTVQRSTIGTLPVDHGGTGTNISPTQWGIIYASDASTYASTGAGPEGKVLIGNGTTINENDSNSHAPYWYGGLTLSGAGTAVSPFNAIFSNTVTIDGVATLNSNATIGGTLGVIGDTTLSNDLTVNGTTQLNDTLAVVGNTIIGTDSTASTLEVYGATTLNSTLSVSSTSTLTGNTTIGDDSHASTLEVYGTSTLIGRVGIGCAPDSATTGDWHMLKIHGSTLIQYNNSDSAHIDTSSQTIGSTTANIVQFYPTTNARGEIGKDGNRWRNGYFSHLLNISDGTSSININTNNGTSSIGIITITASIPTIQLDTLSSNEETWTFTNNTGNFELTNSAGNNKTVNILGTDNGWQLNGQIGINTAPESWPTSSTDPHILVINGSTLIKNDSENAAHLDLSTETINSNDYSTIDFYPETNKTGHLGLSDHRWFKVYLGDAVTYGDEYTPIYWNDGQPYQVPVVQKYNFSISIGDTNTTISLSNTYSNFAIVNSIVVDSGISYLNAPLEWSIDNTNGTNIVISSNVAVGGTISGYILVSTGIDNSANPAINFTVSS